MCKKPGEMDGVLLLRKCWTDQVREVLAKRPDEMEGLLLSNDEVHAISFAAIPPHHLLAKMIVTWETRQKC